MAGDSGVQTVGRAIDLLEALVAAGGSASLSELAKAAAIPLPTIHRLMATLMDRGYVRRLPSRRYSLGPRLIRVGEVAGIQLGSTARPYLERVAAEVGESVNLAMMDRDKAVYIAQASPANTMRMFTEVGRRVFCHSTGVGKMLLAQLPDVTVKEILDRAGMPAATSKTVITVNDLLRDLGEIRQRGYSVDDGEQEIGVRCFSVTIPDAPVPSALSVSGPDSRVTFERIEHVIPILHEAARLISMELINTD